MAEDGSLIDPDALDSLSQRAAECVEKALPRLEAEPVEHLHCWVTALPWSDDGVGVWEHEGIHFLAGHNLFKLAPVLGRELAAAVTGEGLAEALRADSKLGAT